MKKITLSQVKPGMVLAKPVYSSDGGILLNEGIVIKKNYIKKFSSYGIQYVYVKENEGRKDRECQTENAVETHSSDDLITGQTRRQVVDVVKDVIADIRAGRSFSKEPVKNSVQRIIGDLLRTGSTVMALTYLKKTDDYTFSHSVNVCTISLGIGINLGLNKAALTDLGFGALLHDIGKTKIPEKILNKPSKLSEKEFLTMQKHTVYGYEFLKENGVHDGISKIALLHHERWDGKGYPFKLKGKEIPFFPRIVAVSDVYDAMTTDRVYKPKSSPNEAVEYINSLSNYHFDYKIVKTFIRGVSIYPTGSYVVLNTEEKGCVISQNENLPTRPIIRVTEDKYGNPIDKIYDLMICTSIFIQEML